jgi:hypothetical protein
MVVAMYTVVLALVAFLYAVMYRTDSHRMRLNWEKVITVGHHNFRDVRVSDG